MVKIACQTCERRLYKASGLLRCMDWKRWSRIVTCTHYIGPHRDCHFKVFMGPEYSDTLAHGKRG